MRSPAQEFETVEMSQLINICWIKQPDDFLGKNSNLTYPRPTGLMGPPKAPDNNFGAVDPLGGAMGVPQFSM